MKESQQEIRRVVDSANRLVRDVIADLDHAVNTPTKDWTIPSAKRSLSPFCDSDRPTSRSRAAGLHEVPLIADFERRARGIDPFNDHSFSRGNQSKLFLVLKWAHRRQRAKVMMKGGHSHACNFREFLYRQGFRVIGSHAGLGC
jgi:hypothetical protein